MKDDGSHQGSWRATGWITNHFSVTSMDVIQKNRGQYELINALKGYKKIVKLEKYMYFDFEPTFASSAPVIFKSYLLGMWPR